MNPTIELCVKLRELQWQGYENPQFNDELVESGYAWVDSVVGKIPSPSRKALVTEILKCENNTLTEKELMDMGYAYEALMQIWIGLKTKHD